jgi:hypothetical protein
VIPSFLAIMPAIVLFPVPAGPSIAIIIFSPKKSRRGNVNFRTGFFTPAKAGSLICEFLKETRQVERPAAIDGLSTYPPYDTAERASLVASAFVAAYAAL